MVSNKHVWRLLKADTFIQSWNSFSVHMVRSIALFIVLVARTSVVAANAFDLGVFYILLPLVVKCTTVSPTWFIIVSRVWLSMMIVIRFYVSCHLYLLLCTNTFFPLCEKIGRFTVYVMPFLCLDDCRKENYKNCCILYFRLTKHV